MKQTLKKGWGVSSMICGIGGILSTFMPYFGLPLSILAIIFSNRQKKVNPNAYALTGLVLGIIGIIFNGVMLMGLALYFIFYAQLAAFL